MYLSNEIRAVIRLKKYISSKFEKVFRSLKLPSYSRAPSGYFHYILIAENAPKNIFFLKINKLKENNEFSQKTVQHTEQKSPHYFSAVDEHIKTHLGGRASRKKHKFYLLLKNE